GIAPEAKTSFDGVQGLGGLLAGPYYWDSQYQDGAHIYLNSYGGPPGQDYGSFSWAGDNRTDADNDRLVVFAASNEGPLPNTLSGHAQGKNGLSAAAALNYRADRSRAHDPNLVWESSSRGGSNQSYGRVKPDLVTVGTASIGTMGPGEWEHNMMVGIHNPRPDYIIDVDVYNQNDPTALDGDGIPDYRYMTGTSVAAAQMSGLAMLVREYIREVGGISDPNQTNSQLVKALLINGAVRMDPYLYDYPGYDQGWGRIDLMQSLYPPFPRTNRYEESAMSTTGTWSPSFDPTVETSDVPLKVTLVWVDSSGKDLHRDLNLRVVSPSGDIYVGNIYGTQGQYDGWSIPNPSPSDSNPLWDRNLADGWDDVNNVEQVEVEFPEPGIWSIEVVGFAIPSEAPFALVASADFGPTSGPKIELSTDHPLLMVAALNDDVIFPFEVTNSGSTTDSVFLGGETPPGIDLTFESTFITDLQSGETVKTYATISAYAGAYCGANHLRINATSLGNTSVRDQLDITLAVRCDAVPQPIQVTSGSVDELDPSVLTFNDGTTDHIFIAYRKTTLVAPNGTHGGVNVWVAHATLDGEGLPVLPFEHIEVSNWNDNPYNLKLTNIPSGTYQNRIFVFWVGDDPEAVSKDNDSYGVLSYSDPPYDTWNRVVIERNVGRSVINDARTHIPVWRYDGTPGGELIWIWEYLAYTNPDAVNPIAVETWYIISRDGGESWPACDSPHADCYRVSPFDNNYYFFPDACVDTRDVLWVFFYYRLPAGYDRNLMVRLYDDNGWQGNETPLIPRDDVSLIWRRPNTNIQWPTCVATSEGLPNNRVYVTATNDMGGVDLSLFVGYLEGHYNTTNPPFGLNVTNTTPETSPNFHGPFGPMGESACNAEYDRRHIVNIIHTKDELTWITYIENNNSYNETNLWTYLSSDGFQTWNLTTLTADSFAKGHQMTDSLTVNGSRHIVYEVFHMNDDNERNVTYDVYLLIYHAGFSLTADAGPNQVVNVNDLVILNGSGSSDPDGVIVDWMWDFGDGSPTAHGEIVNHTYTSAGRYTVTLLVTDNDNLTDSDTALITVLPELVPPVSDPDGPYSGRKNFPVYLTGNGSYDPDGMIVDLEWNFGDGSPNAHGWWVSHAYSSGGSFNITLTVTDDDNMTDTATTYAVIEDQEPGRAEIQDAVLSGSGLADVKISWLLSPDDGGVEDDVIAYEVYYGTTYNRNGAGYALLQSVPSGTTTYTHSGGGHGDNNTYFYIVKAVDDIGQRTFGQQAVKFARHMPSGMQLISIPVLMSDTSVQKVFQTVDFKRVIYYDAMAGKRHNWRTFDTRKTYNSLKNVNEKMALCVEVTQQCYLTVTGLVPLSTTISLVVGWNFIGYASFFDSTVSVSFDGAIYQKVEGYDPGNSPWYLIRLAGSDIMQFGNG
ncbi:MAG: PKD domain-containing protein, partial [Methanobacteriota archaeon]